nr:MAG TPA: hypothetical protein [Caudoviricetes sp.]DAU11417.1 MAG TPA: hypothetical protein [Caudoviricetes sp.]
MRWTTPSGYNRMTSFWAYGRNPVGPFFYF